jgi:hypothetical protein
MSKDDHATQSWALVIEPVANVTALNSRGPGAAREFLQNARSSLASSREPVANAERLINRVQLEPVREPITRRDLAKAEHDVATSEVKIGRQAELIARLRTEGKRTEQAEALELEMKTVLWHQRGLVFELRRFLRRARSLEP